MDEHQHELRLAAEKAFRDSLEKLQETLISVDEQKAKSHTQAELGSPSKDKKPERAAFDLSDLEEAAADIEEFMQSRRPQSSGE